MKISVIVPTYNRPEALRLCLLSLARQSQLPDEVIIADDGSTEETKNAIEDFRSSKDCRFELKHAWQVDNGFRKPKIINESVRQSEGDYLIFLDGDCMAHKRFVESHIGYSEPMAIIGGKRVEYGRKLTKKILNRQKLKNRLGPGILLDSVVNDTRRCLEAVRIKNPFVRKLMHRDRIADDGIWGCNFSIYKKLFYEINGCDEDFLDGSGEDNDLGLRVLNQGGKVKSVRAYANVFHLWHSYSWSFDSEQNLHGREIINRRIRLKEKRCVNGIEKAGPQ